METHNSIKEDKVKEEEGDNEYHCEAIIHWLMSNYLGLFSLWSGALLGDLSCYTCDRKQENNTKLGNKTRDTNCHPMWMNVLLLIERVSFWTL